jgi:hypothetical protein
MDGRSRSISGLSPWSVLIPCHQDSWNPEFRIPDTDSSLGTFALVHEGLTLMHLLTNPMAVGFSSRDLTAQTGSELVHSPTTSWTWKNQRSRCSLGPWGSTIPISSLFMKIEEKEQDM